MVFLRFRLSALHLQIKETEQKRSSPKKVFCSKSINLTHRASVLEGKTLRFSSLMISGIKPEMICLFTFPIIIKQVNVPIWLYSRYGILDSKARNNLETRLF